MQATTTAADLIAANSTYSVELLIVIAVILGLDFLRRLFYSRSV